MQYSYSCYLSKFYTQLYRACTQYGDAMVRRLVWHSAKYLWRVDLPLFLRLTRSHNKTRVNLRHLKIAKIFLKIVGFPVFLTQNSKILAVRKSCQNWFIANVVVLVSTTAILSRGVLPCVLPVMNEEIARKERRIGNYYNHELRHYLVRYIGTLFRPFSSSVKLIIHYLPIETRPLFQLT